MSRKNIVFDGKINLKDELGYWEENRIYIYNQGLSTPQKFGVFIHELVEMILVKKLNFPEKYAHFIANIFEFIASFGKPAEQVWQRD